MTEVRPRLSLRAVPPGVQFQAATAARTRLSAASETRRFRLTIYDAVAVETPRVGRHPESWPCECRGESVGCGAGIKHPLFAGLHGVSPGRPSRGHGVSGVRPPDQARFRPAVRGRPGTLNQALRQRWGTARSRWPSGSSCALPRSVLVGSLSPSRLVRSAGRGFGRTQRVMGNRPHLESPGDGGVRVMAVVSRSRSGGSTAASSSGSSTGRGTGVPRTLSSGAGRAALPVFAPRFRRCWAGASVSGAFLP